MVDTPSVLANGRTTAVAIGPFEGGLHNSSGSGEFIEDKELFKLINLEVDTDRSLVNRPPIRSAVIAGTTSDLRIIGRYTPSGGGKFLVLAWGTTVQCYNPATNTLVGPAVNCATVCCIQFKDLLYVIPAVGSSNGGYFTSVGGSAPTWTTVAAIPGGTAVAAYQQRLWIITSNSQVRYSGILNGDTWGGTDVFNVDVGNGEELVYMVVLYNDIIFFKQHSTYRFGYANSPLNAQLSQISGKIGVPAINCAVVYDNSNVYVLHDNTVYELNNYNYSPLTQNVAMTQSIDPDITANGTYGLTIYRNRLFVRYYAHLYVYLLQTNRWCEWQSTRKFNVIVSIPSADLGLDTAYAATVSSAEPVGTIYNFRDNRVDGVGPTTTSSTEMITCSIQTRTHDLDVPHAYKVLMWWGCTIATLGDVTAQVVVPNAGQNPTWDYMKAHYTWDSVLAAGIPWDSRNKIVFDTTRPPELGVYGKKFLKFNKKLRFRQAYFTISTVAVVNTISDACVRIFDITLFVNAKELVSKATT